MQLLVSNILTDINNILIFHAFNIILFLFPEFHYPSLLQFIYFFLLVHLLFNRKIIKFNIAEFYYFLPI